MIQFHNDDDRRLCALDDALARAHLAALDRQLCAVDDARPLSREEYRTHRPPASRAGAVVNIGAGRPQRGHAGTEAAA